MTTPIWNDENTTTTQSDTADSQLVFVHLSDIHFQYKRSATPYDLDQLVREELKRDALKLTKQFVRVDGILVCGDVAYGGKKEEYEIAAKWLEQLTTTVECPNLNVYVIPGNHDIDRDALKNNEFIYQMHKDILEDNISLDDKLAAYMSHKNKASMLFESQEAYQDFARNYGCFTNPQEPCWEKSLPFDAKMTLRLRGINSAIFCGENDGSKPRNQLAVGERQSAHARQHGVICLTMCHHPSKWLKDEENFDRRMLAPGAVPIQLFGHEHNFQIEKKPHVLRLYAGAMQPNRKEDGWIPRYNILTMNLTRTEEGTQLEVAVWAREWNDEMSWFEADKVHCPNDQPFLWKTPIQEDTNETVSTKSPKTAHVADELPSDNQPVSMTDKKKEADAIQQLINAFVTLPYHQVFDVASELNLVEDTDEDTDTNEMYRRFFLRAQSRVRGFAALWDAVAMFSSKLEGQPNPF